MIPFFLLVCVAAVKVFKKTTPNGKITIYLSKRDFLDHSDGVDPIEGVVVVEHDYLKDRKIFGQLTTTYRYGREEDEVMGLKFSKELILAKKQIAPSTTVEGNLSSVQEKLMKKFPSNAPCSVLIHPGENSSGKPLGVEYAVKCMVGNTEKEPENKRSCVSLIVKKLQYAPTLTGKRLPRSLNTKDFSCGNGRLNLEVTLDKGLYYHGEELRVNVAITNCSRKTVKNIKCHVVQNCEVTMVNAKYSNYVAGFETREGCPIIPGNSFSKMFYLIPLAFLNKNKFGIALDGFLKDEDVNLASSTLLGENVTSEEALGVVISYCVRVKLNCGMLAGELVTDVPFKLMQPAPGSKEERKMKILRKSKSIEQSDNNDSRNDEDNIIFEDFVRKKVVRANE